MVLSGDTPLKQIDFSFLGNPLLSIAPHLVVELMNWFPLQGGMLTRSWAGKQSCREFMNIALLSCTEDAVLLWSTLTSAWALWGIFYKWHICGWALPWHFGQLQVSALTIYYCARMLAWWGIRAALTYKERHKFIGQYYVGGHTYHPQCPWAFLI